MTSKELTELIHQNTRIILPEFGAFLVKDSGDKGFIPANVSFSPFLRYNDGMLEVYVAKKRGISKEEAAKVVHEFVEFIKNELLEKGFFEVEGLGDLKRDQRGSLSFMLSRPGEHQKTNEKVIPKSDSAKENILPIHAVESDKSDEKTDPWINKDKPIKESVDAKKPRKITGEKTIVEKLTASKKAKNEPVAIDTPIIEITKSIEPETTLEIEPESSIEITPTFQPSNNKVPLESNSAEKEIKIPREDISSPLIEIENTQKDAHAAVKKNNLSWLIYTVSAIALVVIIFFVVRNYYFSPFIDESNYESIVSSEPAKNIKDIVEAKEKVEKPKDEIDKAFNEDFKEERKPTKEQLRKEKEQEDAIAKTLIQNSEKTTSSGIKFYIIAGSFKNPDFAKKYMNEMKELGYKATVVIQPSGMNAVAIGVYSTRDEANKAIKEFKSKFPNLWILKK